MDSLIQREKYVNKLNKAIKEKFPQENYQVWVFGSLGNNRIEALNQIIEIIEKYCVDNKIILTL